MKTSALILATSLVVALPVSATAAQPGASLPVGQKTTFTNAATVQQLAENTAVAQAEEQAPATAPAQAEEQAPVAAPAAAPAPAAMEERSGFSTGSVVRSMFTTNISEREPVDNVSELNTNTEMVYFFTELRDMEGQTAKHRWEYKGEVMAEVEFNVRGPRWRVWSSKKFVPEWTGEWKVTVLNGVNDVIGEEILQYVAADSGAQ